ncbi:hypothetical protein LCGC14_0444390 [marine sediment metagenome]|uniref:Uncharacterized protein n=1 Tax=marine sediment metagenome TaxID=412755 RepID=A0A0F9SJL6_9ZZZZ
MTTDTSESSEEQSGSTPGFSERSGARLESESDADQFIKWFLQIHPTAPNDLQRHILDFLESMNFYEWETAWIRDFYHLDRKDQLEFLQQIKVYL